MSEKLISNPDRIKTPCSECDLAKFNCPNPKRRIDFEGIKVQIETGQTIKQFPSSKELKAAREVYIKMPNSCKNFKPIN